MGGGARRGGEAEEAAAVAGATALAAVTVDGGLQLARGAEPFPLTLVGVQILHVPEGRRRTNRHETGAKTDIHTERNTKLNKYFSLFSYINIHIFDTLIAETLSFLACSKLS